MAKTKIPRTFTENMPTISRKIIFPKLVQNHLSVDFKFPDSYPKTHQEFSENNRSRLLLKAFFEFYNFPKFFENFETGLVNVRFQFCL